MPPSYAKNWFEHHNNVFQPMTTTRAHAEFGIDFALNTGTNMPAIGLGTWKIRPEESGVVVQKAYDLGYRLFDCSPIHGNQKEVGDAIHRIAVDQQCGRPGIFVTSKIWNTNHSRRDLYAEVEQTLRDLRCHHLDLLLLHWPVAFRRVDPNEPVPKDISGNILLDDIPLQETWVAMEELFKDGKTRAIGVCNFPLDLLQKLMQFADVPPAVLQIEHHPYLQQRELVDFCHAKGIHVSAYSPLGSTDRKHPGLPTLLADPVLHDIARKHNRAPAQIVLRWCVQRGISAVPKAISEGHLRENLHVFDFQLTDDDMNRIAALERGVRYVDPRQLWNIDIFSLNGYRPKLRGGEFREQHVPYIPSAEAAADRFAGSEKVLEGQTEKETRTGSGAL